MHEYSIVQALIDRVEQEARGRGATQVHRVRVSIGTLSGVEVELLRTAFETIRHRTICQGATLDVKTIAARWQCRQCGAAIDTGAPLRCAECGERARLVSGDEIMLDQIEMEAANV